MSRGFDGFEIDDFQRPDRDANRGPDPDSRSGWDAVRRRERIRDEEERLLRRLFDNNGPPCRVAKTSPSGEQSACKRAGLPKINWHCLRHTHGTLLHVQGTPLKVAQAQLGHSHMATTLEVYTHASVVAQRQAVNLLDEQVFPSVPKNAAGSRNTAEVAWPTN